MTSHLNIVHDREMTEKTTEQEQQKQHPILEQAATILSGGNDFKISSKEIGTDIFVGGLDNINTIQAKLAELGQENAVVNITVKLVNPSQERARKISQQPDLLPQRDVINTVAGLPPLSHLMENIYNGKEFTLYSDVNLAELMGSQNVTALKDEIIEQIKKILPPDVPFTSKDFEISVSYSADTNKAEISSEIMAPAEKQNRKQLLRRMRRNTKGDLKKLLREAREEEAEIIDPSDIEEVDELDTAEQTTEPGDEAKLQNTDSSINTKPDTTENKANRASRTKLNSRRLLLTRVRRSNGNVLIRKNSQEEPTDESPAAETAVVEPQQETPVQIQETEAYPTSELKMRALLDALILEINEKLGITFKDEYKQIVLQAISRMFKDSPTLGTSKMETYNVPIFIDISLRDEFKKAGYPEYQPPSNGLAAISNILSKRFFDQNAPWELSDEKALRKWLTPEKPHTSEMLPRENKAKAILDGCLLSFSKLGKFDFKLFWEDIKKFGSEKAAKIKGLLQRNGDNQSQKTLETAVEDKNKEKPVEGLRAIELTLDQFIKRLSGDTISMGDILAAAANLSGNVDLVAEITRTRIDRVLGEKYNQYKNTWQKKLDAVFAIGNVQLAPDVKEKFEAFARLRAAYYVFNAYIQETPESARLNFVNEKFLHDIKAFGDSILDLQGMPRQFQTIIIEIITNPNAQPFQDETKVPKKDLYGYSSQEVAKMMVDGGLATPKTTEDTTPADKIATTLRAEMDKPRPTMTVAEFEAKLGRNELTPREIMLFILVHYRKDASVIDTLDQTKLAAAEAQISQQLADLNRKLKNKQEAIMPGYRFSESEEAQHFLALVRFQIIYTILSKSFATSYVSPNAAGAVRRDMDARRELTGSMLNLLTDLQNTFRGQPQSNYLLLGVDFFANDETTTASDSYIRSALTNEGIIEPGANRATPPESTSETRPTDVSITRFADHLTQLPTVTAVDVLTYILEQRGNTNTVFDVLNTQEINLLNAQQKTLETQINRTLRKLGPDFTFSDTGGAQLLVILRLANIRQTLLGRDTKTQGERDLRLAIGASFAAAQKEFSLKYPGLDLEKLIAFFTSETTDSPFENNLMGSILSSPDTMIIEHKKKDISKSLGNWRERFKIPPQLFEKVKPIITQPGEPLHKVPELRRLKLPWKAIIALILILPFTIKETGPLPKKILTEGNNSKPVSVVPESPQPPQYTNSDFREPQTATESVVAPEQSRPTLTPEQQGIASSQENTKAMQERLEDLRTPDYLPQDGTMEGLARDYTEAFLGTPEQTDRVTRIITRLALAKANISLKEAQLLQPGILSNIEFPSPAEMRLLFSIKTPFATTVEQDTYDTAAEIFNDDSSSNEDVIAAYDRLMILLRENPTNHGGISNEEQRIDQEQEETIKVTEIATKIEAVLIDGQPYMAFYYPNPEFPSMENVVVTLTNGGITNRDGRTIPWAENQVYNGTTNADGVQFTFSTDNAPTADDYVTIDGSGRQALRVDTIQILGSGFNGSQG